MNKVLIIGRLVRDPETKTTGSGIKMTRFTIAVNRQFSEDQADFIPVVAWRNQADFMDKYIKKGALMSVEGRFTSSSYKDQEGKTIYRNEITADRVQSLESKKQSQNRTSTTSATATQTISFAEQNKPAEKTTNEENKDVPWELDL